MYMVPIYMQEDKNILKEVGQMLCEDGNPRLDGILCKNWGDLDRAIFDYGGIKVISYIFEKEKIKIQKKENKIWEDKK